MRGPTKAWIAMMALTAATALGLIGGLNAWSAPIWIAALGMVTALKGRLILLDFLELRRAGPWRRAILSGFLAAVTLVTAGLLIGSI